MWLFKFVLIEIRLLENLILIIGENLIMNDLKIIMVVMEIKKFMML